MAECRLINLRACRNDTGWIILCHDRGVTHGHLPYLGILQFTVVPTHILPFLQLMVKKSLERVVNEDIYLSTQHLLTGRDLERTQTILIQVIGIDLLYRQGSIRVTRPAAAQIEFTVDS